MQIEDILDFFKTSSPNRLNTNMTSWDYLASHAPHISNALKAFHNFDEEVTTVRDVLYCMQNGIPSIPKCPQCGKTLSLCRAGGTTHFPRYCSKECRQCKSSLETRHEKYILTCMERYGVENVSTLKDVREKVEATCLERYQTTSPLKNKDIHHRTVVSARDTPEKTTALNQKINKQRMATMMERYGTTSPFVVSARRRYGVDSIMRSEDKEKFLMKSKETQMRRYRALYSQTSECKDKITTSKRRNNSFNRSKIEDDFADYLTSIYQDTIRQYKCIEYPYNCDFYIPILDLFIELQGNWTHGGHPFNPNSDKDITRLMEWKEKAQTSKFYEKAIEVWTQRDVRKREMAYSHGLHYLEIFSTDIDECVKALESYLSKT